MIYFDNSATTPVREEVLETFCEVTRKFIGNPNSLHQLGFNSRKLMHEATRQVADLLHVKENEIIFTSSASESNNLAIKGLLDFYPNRKKLIITTELEHASILETLQQLSEDIDVKFVKLNENGKIDLEDLKAKLEEEPLLVSIHHVNSEIGIIQDIDTIGDLIKKYPKTFFHVDGTQSVGKIPLALDNVDLFSFSAHKFYGLKGIACLVKKEKVNLKPLISGGASQTIYRAGTPSVALIASLAKALRLILNEQADNYQKVEILNQKLRDGLKDEERIVINSSLSCSPYIFNFSILNTKPETIIHKFDQFEIYIATKTACSSNETYSKALFALTKNKNISSSSLRISFSSRNTIEEVLTFIKILKEEIL